MLKIYEIDDVAELEANTGFKHDYDVKSTVDGSAPSDWADITIKGFVCDPDDLTTVLDVMTITQDSTGGFEASLTEAEVGALSVGNVVLVFLYKVTGDTSAYPLGKQNAVIGGGLPDYDTA